MTQMFSNSASTILSSAITGTTTSLLVSDGSNFPIVDSSDPNEFSICTLEDASGLFEIVKVVSHAGGSNVFVVVRAQEATGVVPGVEGNAYSTSDRFELRLTAGALEEFLQRTGEVIDGGNY